MKRQELRVSHTLVRELRDSDRKYSYRATSSINSSLVTLPCSMPAIFTKNERCYKRTFGLRCQEAALNHGWELKVNATCRRLIRARINDCQRRLNYSNDKMLLCLSKLKELIPTPLLDTLTTIADKRANKTTEQHQAILVQSKLTRLQHAAHKKR